MSNIVVHNHSYSGSLPSLLAGSYWSRFSAGPRFAVREHAGGTTLSMDVTGVDEQDIDIEVRGRLLTIKVTRSEESAGNGWQRKSFAGYRRTVTIPAGVDHAAIEARLENGVLSIELPRAGVTTYEAKPSRVAGRLLDRVKSFGADLRKKLAPRSQS